MTEPHRIEDRGFESPCWIWTNAIASNGYGAMWDRRVKKVRSAHCIYYEIHVGSIPEGLDLDHLCRVRSCVNPDHLEAVTRRENLLRGMTLTAAAAAATHCPQGHAYDAANTYVHPRTGWRRCRACRRDGMNRTYARKKLIGYEVRDQIAAAELEHES